MVLLTDGEDTDSAAASRRRSRTVRAQGDSDNQVRVFTIAYSAGRARRAPRRSRRSPRPRAGSPTRATPRTSSRSTGASRASSDGRVAAALLALRLQPGADRQRAHAAVQRRAARGDPDRRPGAPGLPARAGRRHRGLRHRGRAHLLRRGRGEQGARAREGQAPRERLEAGRLDPRGLSEPIALLLERRAPARGAHPRRDRARRAALRRGLRRGRPLHPRDRGRRAPRAAALRGARRDPAVVGRRAPAPRCRATRRRPS